MNPAAKFRKQYPPLGAGAFGQTFKVDILDSKLRREYKSDVAVIKIPLNKEKENALIQEVITNVRLMGSIESLDEKYIVKWLGCEPFDGFHVMVMEFVDGKDLRKTMGAWLQESELRGGADPSHFMKFRITSALRIVKDICAGLSIIHGNNILHRDIKPENILIPKKGNAKIADLGVSAIIRSEELASTTAGTIYYMAPEILIDNQGGYHSDVYSTGVLFYEMVTGKLPYFGDSMGAIFRNIERGKPVPAICLNTAVDPRLNEIIMKAMHRDCDHRYVSAGDLLKAIEGYERGENSAAAYEDECIQEAVRLDDAGRFNEAIERLRGLIKAHPRAAKAYLQLGAIYNKRLHEDKALAVFEEGVRQNPGCGLLYRDLALLLFRQGRFDRSLEAIDSAVAKNLDSRTHKHAMMLRNVIEERRKEQR